MIWYCRIFLILQVMITPAMYAKQRYYRQSKQTSSHASATTTQAAIAQQMQKNRRIAQRRMAKFCQPITYTQSGIKCWIKHTYNNYSYSQKFLPFNLNHLEDFLTQAQYNEQPRLYIQSVFKLFIQKIKATPFMNSYSIEEYLEPILQLIHPLMSQEQEYYTKKKQIKKCVYTYLVQEFTTLKHNPDQALDILSENILNSIQSYEEQDLSIIELQYTVKAFLELTLSKLIWHSGESHYIWLNIKEIAQQLAQYEVQKVITPEMLDELFWTLLYKLSYFIELNASELTEQFYATILEDIEENNDLLWSLEEQEDFITTKKEYFRKSLITSHIASKALRNGLLAPSA